MTTQENTQLSQLQKIAVSRKLIEAEIIARAWVDDDFRLQLIANPAVALAGMGVPLPEGKMIRIIQEESDVICLTIPPKPTVDAEADDDELAAVAGGGLLIDQRCHYRENAIKNDDVSGRLASGIFLAAGSIIGLSHIWG